MILLPDLFSFAYVPNWYIQLDELSALALPEPWRFRNPAYLTKNPDNPILERYIHAIFKKQVIDYNTEKQREKAPDYLHVENEFVCFHTGLYTRRYKAIYGCFDRNKRKDSLLNWYFRGFSDELSPCLKYVNPLPKKPRYDMTQYGVNYNPEWPISVDEGGRVMQITLYQANCRGNAKNTIYPVKYVVDNAEDFLTVTALDHVCGKFKDNHRSVDDFEESDCDVMDCDNDHSDDPAAWIYPADLADTLGDVSYIIVPSRHNMMPKDGKSARPRFHAYFPHAPITSAKVCAALKQAIHQQFPFFDGKALDAARFIYGNVTDEIVWHEGEVAIDCILNKPQTKEIPQGQRNATMSHFAGRVVKRYGATDRAHEIFLEEAQKCSPPLDDEELAQIWHSACRFAVKVQAQDGYIRPDEYNNEFCRESLKPSDYSDIGQAKVLSREYGVELKYTAATDYIRFCGQYWIESKQQAVGAAEEFLDLQLEDAKDEVAVTRDALKNLGVAEEDIMSGGKALEKKIGMGQMDAYLAYMSALAYKSFVMKRRDMKYVVSALQAAKPMLEIQVSDLDRDGFLLNTPGGTYYLPDGLAGRRDYSPEDYITKITAAAPGDKGKELWLDALDTIFCGDADLIAYVQKIVGMAAVGKVYVESLIIAYGEGRNGKSTFWNAIARVLGSYSGNMSADTLTVGCKRNVKPELAEAKGKRLIIAAELEEGMRLNTSVVKQMCSTDEIFAEKKYKDPFSFTPSHTLVLYTNHLPRVGANDPGTWRRLIVIPFNAKIEGSGDVKNFADFLVAEAAPSIMAWIIKGAQMAIQEKFHIACPACVEETMRAYREDNDWLGHFLSECCVLGDDLMEKSGEFYDSYDAAKAKLDALQTAKARRLAQADSIGGFMFELSEYTEAVTEFDEGLWLAVIEKATAYHDGRLVFTFQNGTEIEG